MEECLAYFRVAVTDPASVPPWAQWWAANEPLAHAVFSFADYVRLKHRRLLGARQILQRLGEIPSDFIPLSYGLTGTCGNCGERNSNQAADSGEVVIVCPNCGSH